MPYSTNDNDKLIMEAEGTVLEPEVLPGDNVSDTSLVKVYKETIMSSVKLSLKGQRLLRVVLSLVSPSDQANKTYSFNVSDYMNVYGIDRYAKQQLSDAADELLATRELPYENDPEGFTKAGLISYIDVKDGVATFSIPPRLLEFYNAAREKNEYILGYTKNFISSYSYPFYELFLLRLAENIDNPNGVEFFMSIDRMRQWLRLENKYVNKKTGVFAYNNFKMKILYPVKEDINRSIDNENPYCNINFDFTEEKKGRSIIGINFKVWRVSVAKAEKPSVNPYYDQLPPDVKIGYDTLIALQIKKSYIETAILDLGNAHFCDTVKYIVTKKNKGRAYLLACLRGGWTSSDPVSNINFLNLEKVYSTSKQEKELLEKTELFITSIPASAQKLVLNKIKKELQDAPQIYRHIVNLDLEEILAARDIKIFVIEQLAMMIKSGEDKELHKLFVDFNNANSNENKYAERAAITSLLEKYRVNKVAWEAILDHDDEYIKANINYCVEKYGPKQKDFSGAIVDAIKKDYAQYEKTKAEAERKAALKAAEDKAKAERDKELESRQQEIDDIFDDFMNHSTIEDREAIKASVLNSGNNFLLNAIARAFKVPASELKKIEVDKLLTSAIFKNAFKGELNKMLRP